MDRNMRVSCYVAFFFLLSTQHVWAVPSVPSDHGSKSDSAQYALLARYADDVYAQSGGVRVRAGELNAGGVEVYQQFLVHERRAQRAFLWFGLKLGDINFAHLGATAPMIRIADAEDMTDYSERELLEIAYSFGFASAEELKDMSQLAGIPLELLRDVAWNLDSSRKFTETYDSTLWYNDMPGASAHLDASSAYNDPRYRDSDAVVNYRANARTLIKECLNILGDANYNDRYAGLQTSQLLHRLRRAVKVIRTWREHPTYLDVLLQKELERLHPHTFDLEVNVDGITGKFGRHEMYPAICEEIDAQIERTHHDAASVVDATKELQEIAHRETARARRYAMFNDPRSQEIVQLQLDADVPMRRNIEEVYKRAVRRREEFHKMTEPFVVSAAHATTYRVHFTDPEYRYVAHETAISSRSKQWYQATWKRLMEPIFKDVIIEEIKDPFLRDIVLIDSDPSEESGTQAYVINKQHIVVYCDKLDKNHREAAVTIRHEYEHTADDATESRTSDQYDLMEDDRDLRTLSQETLESRIKSATKALQLSDHDPAREHLHALKVARDALRVDAVSAPYNDHNVFGFPSGYAQTDADEATAEQRYAMRNEAIRTALLRRMSRYATPGPRQADAERQKKFYDVARQEMERVAPTLWKLWGENYDGRDAHEWGLAPGETQRVDKHYQIVSLDNTIATTIASERLAAKLLQQGYDVSITGYTSSRKRPICILQSNLEDPPPGGHYPKFVLYIVGGSTMDGKTIAQRVLQTFRDLTPTGRDTHSTRSVDNLNLDAVTIVRSPHHPMFFSRDTNEKMRTAFIKEFRMYSEAPRQISMHDGYVGMASDGRIVSLRPRQASQEESIWVEDMNLYRDTIFAGWSVDEREVWEPIDYESQTECRTIG